MSPENVIAKAELNKEGLYQVKLERDTSKTLTVSVFPRIAVNNLSQAVYLLHASLGHIPQQGMVQLAKDALENPTNPMFKNYPRAITSDVINRYYLPCKACLMAQQKKLPFLSRHVNKSTLKSTSTLEIGDRGSVDFWGPFPEGRLGHKYVFSMVEAKSGFSVNFQCSNIAGDTYKLVRKALDVFTSYGVTFKVMTGDSAFNNESTKHVLNTAYGTTGIRFQRATPDEHETNGIVERFFESAQRRGSANVLAFIHDSSMQEFLALDALIHAMDALNYTPRRSLNFRNPRSFLGLPPLDFNKQLMLPFGIKAIAHAQKLQSKLHGHGIETIFIGSSDESVHRAGLFLNTSTLEVIMRRSFSIYNEDPFYGFVSTAEGVAATYDSEENDNEDLVSDPVSEESTDEKEDSEDENASEIDKSVYVFQRVSLGELTVKERKKLRNMSKTKQFMERSNG